MYVQTLHASLHTFEYTFILIEIETGFLKERATKRKQYPDVLSTVSAGGFGFPQLVGIWYLNLRKSRGKLAGSQLIVLK